MPDIKANQFINDKKAVSVIMGTLLLMLVTIVAASGVAMIISSAQKDMAERQTYQSTLDNEHLEIMDINPEGNSTHWNMINLTVLNMDIKDSKIAAIAINDNYAKNYKILNKNGEIKHNAEYPQYPIIYNSTNMLEMPAKKNKRIIIGFEDIVVNTSEKLTTYKWNNLSLNYTLVLQNHPYLAGYPYNCEYELYNNTNNTLIKETGNYSLNKDGTLTFFGRNYTNSTFNDSAHYNNSTYIGPIYNNSEYRIYYTSTFQTFQNNYFPETKEVLEFKIMSMYTNFFRKNYIPPTPFAKIYFETENKVNQSSGNHYFQDYIVMDASESYDEDGTIVRYNWAMWHENGTLIYDYNLTGKKVRPMNIDPYGNYTIDLEVIDDDRMTGKLSQHAGNITLP